MRTLIQYGYLIYRNGATRTYEFTHNKDDVDALVAPDWGVEWFISDDLVDYFSYNYLADPNTKKIVHDPIEEPIIPDTPQPDAVGMMIVMQSDFPMMLIIAYCACVKPYAAPYYTPGRMVTWAGIKRNNLPDWLPPHWIANLETWCRWNGMPLAPFTPWW